MTKAEARQIARIADDIAHVAPCGAAALRGLAAPRRKPSKKQRRDRLGAATLHHEEVRAANKKNEQAEKDSNRAEVMARADHLCERILGDPSDPPGERAAHVPHGAQATERDHFWGRARDESVEGSWALCPGCHHAKTHNRPSRLYWLWNFQFHCARIYRATLDDRYREQVVKTQRAMALELAQHPAASRSGAEGERAAKSKTPSSSLPSPAPKENER